MTITITIANLYNTILEEERKELIIKKGDDTFKGALMWKNEDLGDDVMRGKIEEQELEVNELNKETVENIIETAIEMMNKADMKVYDSTGKTMKHWQYLHSFSEVIF